ncbi:MAG: ABC transporter permease subunit [Planctomycetota bacterium]
MSARGKVLLALLGAGALAALWLGLTPAGLIPRAEGWTLLREFAASALRPALTHEVPPSFTGATPFLAKLGLAVLRTLAFALAAMSLALPLGAVLGLVASDAWWRPEAFGGGRLRRVARPLQVATRVVIALMRSVHELLWAILFLAAFGLNTASAVIALAIPFAGTLAKVFSEMLDEAPDNAARALHAAGAGPLSVLVFGRVPRALADMAAYTFYRFECAVRSSAVLGFFGYPTLGFHLSLAFEDLRFREVWSYIYAIVALVAVFEVWSSALRRRLVA